MWRVLPHFIYDSIKNVVYIFFLHMVIYFTECYKKTFALNSRRRVVGEDSFIGEAR